MKRPGMNKLVVNHLDKTIVTSDGATIVQELEVMHPAAKMVVMASQMQEQEAGDGTSLVVTLTGRCLLCSIQCRRGGGGRGGTGILFWSFLNRPCPYASLLRQITGRFWSSHLHELSPLYLSFLKKGVFQV